MHSFTFKYAAQNSVKFYTRAHNIKTLILHLSQACDGSKDFTSNIFVVLYPNNLPQKTSRPYGHSPQGHWRTQSFSSSKNTLSSQYLGYIWSGCISFDVSTNQLSCISCRITSIKHIIFGWFLPRRSYNVHKYRTAGLELALLSTASYLSDPRTRCVT